MKINKWPLLILVAVFALSFVAGDLLAQAPRKAPKVIYTPPDETFGFIPGPHDLSHIQPPPFLQGAMQPSTWDWRTLNGVTPPKNQNPYGTCWSFAACSDLESKVRIREAYIADYSELNIVACNANQNDCNAGGNAYITASYLALLGSVDETCDPYPGGCPTPTCINPACTFLKQLTEWRLIADDVTTIKNAVMTHGPVYTSMYASFPGFSTYDGTYCLQYYGSEDPNHAVLIVGWDDSMCGGNGAWIVKNSWGTSWGAGGYFYIEYGSARIGESSNVITDYKDYDPTETIYYYDEWGWWSSVGYGDGNDWGLVELDPTTNDYLNAVDFWATASPTSYTIYVYDDFDGSNLTNLLAGPIAGSVVEAGYYSEPLTTPLLLSIGDPVYLVIDFTTTPYGYPVPYDDSGPMETGKTYISNDGATWNDLGGGGYGMGDIGIRGRVGPLVGGECSKEGDPAFYVDFGEDLHDVIAGETVCWTLGPCNFGFVSTTCPDTDTFCVHAYDTQGWIVTGVPPLQECQILEPGYLWWQDICVTVPCDVAICDYDTVYAVMAYCDMSGFCAPDCGDCEDPNMYQGDPYYAVETVVLHVIESPPALYIDQDSVYCVEQGQTAAYVPFTICNGDPCADPVVYNYTLSCVPLVGTICTGYPQAGSTGAVPGGECEDVYGIVDASTASSGDMAELTIIAWDITGTVYDTCVQIVMAVEPVPVPLFTAPVAVILVLAMILAAAVFMKRRAASRA